MGQKLANSNVMDIINDLEKKIRYIFQGSHRLYLDSIIKKTSSTNLQNAHVVYEFLLTEHNNNNVRINTTLTYIKIISLFNEFVHYKDLEKITKNDIIDFLNSSRKIESEDPSHKWIGTYNTRRMILSKFFRWLYNQYQNNEMDQQEKSTSSESTISDIDTDLHRGKIPDIKNEVLEPKPSFNNPLISEEDLKDPNDYQYDSEIINNIDRLGNSDQWYCKNKDCKVRGDKWLLMRHNCKYKNNNKDKKF